MIVRQNMKTNWHKIESWLKANAPQVYEGLNPPATPEQIEAAEAALGIKLPLEFVASYRIHNGQSSDSPWLFDAWEFLSLERIVEEWTVWKDLLDGGDFKDSRSGSVGFTVEDWWCPLWIPITYDGAGNHDSLDLKPGPKGRKGQIIKMWHDDSERPVVSASYSDWIAGWAYDMERGLCKFSEEYNGIIRGDE